VLTDWTLELVLYRTGSGPIDHTESACPHTRRKLVKQHDCVSQTKDPNPSARFLHQRRPVHTCAQSVGHRSNIRSQQHKMGACLQPTHTHHLTTVCLSCMAELRGRGRGESNKSRRPSGLLDVAALTQAMSRHGHVENKVCRQGQTERIGIPAGGAKQKDRVEPIRSALCTRRGKRKLGNELIIRPPVQKEGEWMRWTGERECGCGCGSRDKDPKVVSL
jgi:hypothetical protein